MEKETVKVDSFVTLLEFDFTTPRNGSSGARNQFVDEPDTEVYYGTMHASVKMTDLRIRVEMDPYKGNWKDGKWAREQAWKAIQENLSPEVWSKLALGLIEIGKARGRKELQKEFRELLGVRE